MSYMTQSLEDYIETIYMIVKSGAEASVHAVAKELGVKMPSVVKAMRELKRMELVTQQPYSSICLTDKGRRVATAVLRRHMLLRRFLEMLGVGSVNADRDACRMEHFLSAETLDKIRLFTNNGKVIGNPQK
ncbi:MAG: metal-dependent transcriptional regulator [Kiritimatiellae bacterium]|nr:metal-dependent transcriptional regulator [Kiritimatiellia bacterium]